MRYERVVDGETLLGEELSGLRRVLEVVRSHVVGKDAGWNTFQNTASLGVSRPGYQPAHSRLKQTRILAVLELYEGSPVPEQGPPRLGGRRGADRGGAGYAVLDPTFFRGSSPCPIDYLCRSKW